MTSQIFSQLFIAFLILTLGLRFWLASRQIRHVVTHRHAVPPQFADKIGLDAHQKAASYTIAKIKFGLLSLVFDTVILLGFTLFGGLQWLQMEILQLTQHLPAGIVHLTGPGMTYQIALLAAFVLVSGALELPFGIYYQFVLEEKFGFNKMSMGLFISDMIKSTLLGILIGLPLVWVVLSLMDKAGDLWWLYTWIVWCGFQLLAFVLYPIIIAPLFNKFTPLSDDGLKTRIENLLRRVGFASRGVFLMDGSKRSTHSNAYFTGVGSAKRVVFFDTLMSRLTPQEVEAVLAHELGHFKLKHIVKRILVVFALSLGFLALLGYLKTRVWFYTGLGVEPMMNMGNDAMALILFMLALPVFTFALRPLGSITSRKHEFEADAFAAKHSSASDLVAALVKLYEDNASTLTPDPLYSTFYDSHPPASIRIDKLLAAGR